MWWFALVLFGAVGCASDEPTGGNEDDDGSGGSGGSSSTGGAGVGGQGGQPATGGGSAGELPASCFVGAASCNPLSNAPCGQGEACDLGVDGTGTPALSCFPPPNTQILGQACDPQSGPFCAGSMTCFNGTCAPYCCSNSDCRGVPCTPFDASLGTLGACAEAPMCQPAGGPCAVAADCCSNDCHLDHCH